MQRIFALLAVLAATTGGAAAQTYPNKPVKMVVPWPAGGVADICARAIGEEMRATLGQPVIIENRPGASGKIGTEVVARSPADGYTIIYTNPSNHTAPTFVDKQIGFDPIADFTPVIQTAEASYFLVVNANSPYKTAKELMAAARAQPGQLNIANAGLGSVSHFALAMFLSSAKIDVVQVSYKGEGPAVNDLLAGAVQMMVMTGAKPFVDDGRLRALATMSPEPWFNLPDVPPMAQAADLPGFKFVGWQGIAGPAKLPKDVQSKLNAAANTALRSERVQNTLREGGIRPTGGAPELLEQAIKTDLATFRRVIAEAHLTFEQ
ncbi:MAG TPA: tripartite tricarboxylate transporter substrate binding protein [Alphaproteobacteria bacterium]